MNDTVKNIILFITFVSAAIGIAVGLISIVDRIFSDELVIEQRLSPEMMEELKKGDGTITIEKGITIRREDDTRSGSD